MVNPFARDGFIFITAVTANEREEIDSRAAPLSVFWFIALRGERDALRGNVPNCSGGCLFHEKVTQEGVNF